MSESAAEFREEVAEAAKRVLMALSHGRRTAWELKLELKVSHTVLHLALGALLERGKISLQPDHLTYVVEPVGVAPQSPVATA
ncbi:MAG TPA: hypothetical protein VNI01_08715 [Elusimicrobiota bacterium]|nr:hypothetical protein [Elusimicrobiota bacterium]